MSIKVLENPSMFAGVAARVAANGKGLIALVGGSDALQALCAGSPALLLTAGIRKGQRELKEVKR